MSTGSWVKPQHNVEVREHNKSLHPQHIVVRLTSSVYCTSEQSIGCGFLMVEVRTAELPGVARWKGWAALVDCSDCGTPETGPAPAGQPLPFRFSAPSDLVRTGARRDRRQGDGGRCTICRVRPFKRRSSEQSPAKRRPAIRLGAVETERRL